VQDRAPFVPATTATRKRAEGEEMAEVGEAGAQVPTKRHPGPKASRSVSTYPGKLLLLAWLDALT
jgi:hypothetical protein